MSDPTPEPPACDSKHDNTPLVTNTRNDTPNRKDNSTGNRPSAPPGPDPWAMVRDIEELQKCVKILLDITHNQRKAIESLKACVQSLDERTARMA